MSLFIFYVDESTGYLSTWSDLKSIPDSKLEPVILNVVNDEFFLTNRVFPGCFQSVDEGEEYNSEFFCHAENEQGEPYRVTLSFPAIKGEECEDEFWPFDDERYVTKIQKL